METEPSLWELADDADHKIRAGLAIADLISVHPDADDAIKFGADAACGFLRDARELVDQVRRWPPKRTDPSAPE